MFDEEGPLEFRDPIYSNNPYIGRVDANDIPPPHNVSSFVQLMCAKGEKGLDVNWDNRDTYKPQLFKTISSPKAFDLQEPLPLLSIDRPGSRPQDALILKVVESG